MCVAVAYKHACMYIHTILFIAICSYIVTYVHINLRISARISRITAVVTL